jgi:hypothetical protein
VLQQSGGQDIDVFSLDVDGQDYYIWEQVAFAPKVVIVEYNASIALGEAKCVVRDETFKWDGSSYFGASFSAFIKLAERKKYTCVYSNGVNMFFVRTDLLANPGDFLPSRIYRHAVHHASASSDRAWIDI